MLQENTHRTLLIETENPLVAVPKQSPSVKSSNNDDDFVKADTFKNSTTLQSGSAELKTNRLKAVLFVNLCYFAMFFYNVFLKVAVNEKGIYPFDICLVRTILMLIFCTVLMFASKESFYIEKSDRCALFLRCVLDLCGYVGTVFGLPLVPLIVMSTIF